MKAFYGSASYLWLVLATFCTMDQHDPFGLVWITLFVGAYAIIGRGVIFASKLMWDMEHDPAVRHKMMNAYLLLILEQEYLNRYVKYGK